MKKDCFKVFSKNSTVDRLRLKSEKYEILEKSIFSEVTLHHTIFMGLNFETNQSPTELCKAHRKK